MDILAEFQAAQSDIQAKSQRIETAKVSVDSVNALAIQVLFDVREQLGDIIVDQGYPVSKAFYTIPERPYALLSVLFNAPQFEAISQVTTDGDIVPIVNVFEMKAQLRISAPDDAARYLIQWIAEHEQVDGKVILINPSA